MDLQIDVETRRRESLREKGDESESETAELGRAFRTSLKGDRKRRVEDAGKDVDALLVGDPPNAKEAWRRMKGWYKAAVNRAPLPSRATLERIMAERVELYSHVPLPGDNIPVKVMTFIRDRKSVV